MLLGIPYHPGPADIWSLGVILFVCVNGYLPFNPEFLGKLCQELQEVQIEASDFSSPGIQMSNVSRFRMYSTYAKYN